MINNLISRTLFPLKISEISPTLSQGIQLIQFHEVLDGGTFYMNKYHLFYINKYRKY